MVTSLFVTYIFISGLVLGLFLSNYNVLKKLMLEEGLLDENQDCSLVLAMVFLSVAWPLIPVFGLLQERKR